MALPVTGDFERLEIRILARSQTLTSLRTSRKSSNVSGIDGCGAPTDPAPDGASHPCTEGWRHDKRFERLSFGAWLVRDLGRLYAGFGGGLAVAALTLASKRNTVDGPRCGGSARGARRSHSGFGCSVEARDGSEFEAPDSARDLRSALRISEEQRKASADFDPPRLTPFESMQPRRRLMPSRTRSDAR